jgi:hypothetical protein
VRTWGVLNRYKTPPQAVRLTSPRGEVVIWAPTPTVCIQIVSGYGDAKLAEQLVKEQDRILSGRRDVVSFIDALALAGYESSFRTPLAAQARRQIESGQLKLVNMLTRSKLVAMGAAVVNLAVGSKIEVFSDTKAFDERVVAAGGASVFVRSRAAG